VGVGVFGVVPRVVNGWSSEDSEALSDLCTGLGGGSTIECWCYTTLLKMRMSPEDLGSSIADIPGYEWAYDASRSIADFCGIS